MNRRTPRNLLFIGVIFLFLSVGFAAKAFALGFWTNSFKNHGFIGKAYTCEGAGFSPSLFWSKIPEGTVSLSIIMKDVDAPGGVFYHWVVYNIPPGVNGIRKGISPSYRMPGGFFIQGINSFGDRGYGGPCPPPGGYHRYFITIYALDVKLDLGKGANAYQVLRAMRRHIIGRSSIEGRF